jgi:polar amino acid transport system substrate-binding protein
VVTLGHGASTELQTDREGSVRAIHFLLLIAVAVMLTAAGADAAPARSTWSQVMSTKRLVVCAVPSYQPYSWQDSSGTWQGFVADMANDVAHDLHVQPSFVKTSFGTVVLDLQSGKCDVFFGFNATPERALAIDFAGPLYTLGFGALDRGGWKSPGDHWSDLNNPQIRVCYAIGNSSEQQIVRFAPKATRLALPDANDCVLALTSGRADVYIDGIMASLGAVVKNPSLGPVHLMKPLYALPSYAGMRLDDGRFQKFMQRWSEYNRANGNIEEWLTSSMGKIGIKPSLIPPDVHF